MSKASLADTQAALNAVAGKKGFRCVPVSWEDAQRGTVGGTLSCWGGNISDVRLWEKGGQLLYTLRTENWNERLGYVSTKDVAVVVGNEVAGGSAPTPVTLESYLKNIGRYGAYAGIKTSDLYQSGVDGLATIRFQSVFLPIATDEVTEFCTEVYNYNTHSDDDPRNMTLLCTAQGTNAQQDGAGAKRVYLHAVDGDSTVHRYWMEAERSKHKVGGEQKETEEEAKEAAARGKATSIHIGTRAMGTRFNVQMLIQVPLQQKPKPKPHRAFPSSVKKYNSPSCNPALIKKKKGGVNPKTIMPHGSISSSSDSEEEYEKGSQVDHSKGTILDTEEEGDSLVTGKGKKEYLGMATKGPLKGIPIYGTTGPKALETVKKSSKVEVCASSARCQKPSTSVPTRKSGGTSNAARVSRGSEVGTQWKGVSNTEPKRDPSQHATITVTLYYTVAGGIPSEADIEMCVKDLDDLYKACPSDKKLVDCDEVTAELTVKNMIDINTKVTTQAYKPATFEPVKSTFPE